MTEEKKETKIEPEGVSQEGVPQETSPDVKKAISSLLEEVKSLKKDRDILMATADKRAVAHYYARHREDLPPIIKVRTLGGKLILGWRTLVDKGSFQVPGTGRWTEEQTIELVFQDGTKQEIDLMTFNRTYEHVKTKRVGVFQDDKTHQEILKLQRLDNGEELEISVQFVN